MLKMDCNHLRIIDEILSRINEQVKHPSKNTQG